MPSIIVPYSFGLLPDFWHIACSHVVLCLLDLIKIHTLFEHALKWREGKDEEQGAVDLHHAFAVYQHTRLMVKFVQRISMSHSRIKKKHT